MKKFDLTILSLSILVLACVILIAVQPPKHIEATVATINGEPVTQTQLNKTLKEKYGMRGLTYLTNEVLVAQEIKKSGVTVSDEEVKAEVQKLRDQMGSEEKFAEFLDKQGLTVDTIHDKMKQLMIVQKLTEQYNKEHKTQLNGNEWVKELKKNAKIEILDPSLEKK